MLICIRIRFNRLLLFLCDELSNGSVSSTAITSSSSSRSYTSNRGNHCGSGIRTINDIEVVGKQLMK